MEELRRATTAAFDSGISSQSLYGPINHIHLDGGAWAAWLPRYVVLKDELMKNKREKTGMSTVFEKRNRGTGGRRQRYGRHSYAGVSNNTTFSVIASRHHTINNFFPYHLLCACDAIYHSARIHGGGAIILSASSLL